ncbi:hypothetical protein EJB05_01154 [Eragrostis curvula]|uniref:Uncharacterized protein n=1 Tax=Eragrostis curvula TaxID=38414 RepID=A0A5J9WPD5_9POAL|nr:hypothetical protein EJB05_01154 [Eragrostis curvula]
MESWTCREIRGCRHLQELAASCVQSVQVTVDAAVQSAVARPEDITKAITSFLSRAPRTLVDQNRPPRYRLSFMNGLDSEFFTKKVIYATNGEPIKICMVVNDQKGTDGRGLHHRILSAKIKLVVLDGDFNKHNQECWTSEEFRNCIIQPRDNIGAVLTGVSELRLKNDEAVLHEGTLNDNSKFVRSGKFRLGVMVDDNLGERVLEGITEPFIVKDRRGEGHKKHAIPLLNDDVWRLSKISKDGVFHKALSSGSIFFVQDFLRWYYKDEQTLRKELVGQWSKVAYKNMTFRQPDYVLDNGKPRPIDQTTLHELCMLEHKVTDRMQGPNEEYVSPTDDHQGTSDINSRHCKLKRLGSLRLTQTNENSFGFSFCLDPIPEQYCASTSANDITGSVTLHCAATTANEITGSVVLSQAPVTTDHAAYHIPPFTDNDASVQQPCEENQPVRAHFSHSLSSIRALLDCPIYSRHSSFRDSDCHQARAVGTGPTV